MRNVGRIRVACLLAFVWAVLPTSAAASTDPVALMRELSSDEAEARGAAAKRIVESGYFTIEVVARGANTLGDEGWRAFADALLRDGTPLNALALVAAVHNAPPRHAQRLLAVARALNPDAGTVRSPDELERIARRLLIEERGIRNDDFVGKELAIFGHSGVPVVLRLLRESPEGVIDLDRASSVLKTMAQREDVGPLETLLKSGNTATAPALARLDALGMSEASAVLLDAVRQGKCGFDHRLSSALLQLSNRSAAGNAVREWVKSVRRHTADDERGCVASVLAERGTQSDLSQLDEWSRTSSRASTLCDLAVAMCRLGGMRGIDLLVQIVEEGDGGELKPHDGRDVKPLRDGGFSEGYRQVALLWLDMVSTQTPMSPRPKLFRKGKVVPWTTSRYKDIDRVAAEVRAWWSSARDRISFDATERCWRLKSE